MRLRKVKLRLVSTVALTLALVLSAQAALADYAPTSSDVVGIGSDTVQYAMDFLADGFPSGDTGYNALGNLNRLVNIDATADANSRVAYANNGIGSGSCHPGTGVTSGTGNQTTDHADNTCFLNPTVVLRSGFPPMLRPNGSGNGYDAFRRDVDNASIHLIDYSRSSVCQGPGAGCRNKNVTGIDSVQLATDPFQMLVADTTNAVPLSAAQIKSIYEANTPNCKKWTDVGGSSPNTIKAIVPQTGSGTYSSFAASVGITTLGNCGVQFEENDPTAIHASGAPADAVMPMSGGRLNLYKGLLGNGSSNGYGGYFKDPSCPILVTSPAACTSANNTIAPLVHLVSTGTPSDGQPLWSVTRPLYVYFRDSDVGHTAPYGADKPFQPGSTLNWVRTLLYNPCSAGQTGCVTVGGTTYGPGGPPYINTSAGKALISDAGLTPTYVVTLNGP